MEERVCPYPGLRPFNEDESIYFRGREEHIQKIITQLQEKKFVMLTGASGDGKSSLVYAGVIPNARAGFFKARFNNWVIADFRPERNPLGNMARSLAYSLGYSDEAVVEKELSYGFSSLINLYKSSSWHIDYEAAEWKNAEEKTRNTLKRKGANLIILVDQFEEFFTNSENYANGRPSGNSQVVVNLLLETARLALERQLPIYIICTMRSDFIGQCASFRGLPEYIGFSQFFVPRLKRKEIHQVIEEPATLSGNRISNRLTETLINELNDGFDQLPVLQHALNQVWNCAARGAEEMDLLQLAKLSGLPAAYLPAEDKEKFNAWFTTVPAYKKKFFEQPSLENVLNAHANELYETAYDHYASHTSTEAGKISKEEAQQIIKAAFQCLTKIDDSRAVRNRMTLQEITDVIQRPAASTEVVGGLLAIFREQGNTFLKPFITDNPASKQLNSFDVLDITHESLIRNWDLLTDWSAEENEHWTTFQDFYKQMQRWVKNKKSSDYLLPLGSLSFFETWYATCKPNKYWLKKYDESDDPEADKDARAQRTMEDARQFLGLSRKAIRTKRSLLIISVSVVIVVLSVFTAWAFLERNKAVKQQLLAEQKTQEAVRATDEAIRSKNDALAAQQKASESEQVAVAAKDTALIAKEQAMHSQKEALVSAARAAAEARKAEEQSALAKLEAEKAEKQRLLAEKEKAKAESAEQKALRMSRISLAQNLALKSTTISFDPQLQGLLAMQAYNFTIRNKGEVQDPAVYEALRAAYAALNPTPPGVIKGFTYEPRALAASAPDIAVVCGLSGVLGNVGIAKQEILSSLNVNYKSPVTFLKLSSNGRQLVTGHDNFNVCVWNVEKTDKPTYFELKGHNGLLRAIAFSDDGSKMATGGKDNAIIVWDMKTATPSEIKKINVASGIKALSFISGGEGLAAATEKGDILNISIKSGESKVMYNSSTAMPVSIGNVFGKQYLPVGFADGKVRLFDLNAADFKFRQLNESVAAIESIALSADGKLMAVASADKTIKIYTLYNADLKPVVLKDHKAKVRSLAFAADNRLLAGCDDKTIHVWETSSQVISDKICTQLNRSLLEKEWKQYIGSTITYEKTCGK